MKTKKISFWILFVSVGLLSCSESSTQKLEVAPLPVGELKVAILPVGKVDSLHLAIAEEAIENFYQAKVTLLSPMNLQINMFGETWNDSKSQPIRVVKANAIYDKLSEINDQKDQFDVIIGLTDNAMSIEDKIEDPERQIIRGLGGAAHRVAFVSSYRVKLESNGDNVFREDLSKVVNHEFGHILGLGHCSNSKPCLMMRGINFHNTIPEFCSSCLEKVDKNYLKVQRLIPWR